MNKNLKRKEIKKQQIELPLTYRFSADKKICNHIISLPEFKDAAVIFCFINTKHEIDIRPILEQAWADKKCVAVPKCIGTGIMEAFEIRSFEDLEIGSYGIMEPKSYCSLITPALIDFAIIPCLSCDLDGWRLGHGGGYYDRYLRQDDLRTALRTAVICRHRLLSDHIYHETHDKQMHIVITEQVVTYTNTSF